jgi:hypothetical protein
VDFTQTHKRRFGDFKPNAQEKIGLEKITGEDIPPRLLGHFPCRAFGVKANRSELMKELSFRHVQLNNELRVRSLQGVLKEAEQSRLTKEVSSESLARGSPSEGLKLASMLVLLNHDCTEKNESTGGKHSVDFTKFFLKLCPDTDETIFEDDD